MSNRTRRRGLLILIVALSLALLGGGSRASGQAGVQRAAVVIRFGDGRTVVRVTEFGGTFTGLDLLQASGLPIVEGSGAICRIGVEGCSDPSSFQTCYCQCTGATPACVYWRYLHWSGGEWRYSGTGAGGYIVLDGAMDGWAWGANVRPEPVDPSAVFDPLRLAPGVPQVLAGADTVDVGIAFQGDNDADASATARWRRQGGDWSMPAMLARGPSAFTGRVAEGLGGGTYEVELNYDDPDGINGSQTWVITATLGVEQRLHFPLVYRVSA